MSSRNKNITNYRIGEFVLHSLFDEKILLKKNTSFPKISIVTPSFNQGKFLEQTILSVINQHYPNLEYIIMDGGSTDNSIEIIEKYKKYISYWESKPDNGQAAALKKGFSIATGDIFAWLNSDDVLEPGALFIVSNFFQKYPAIDIVYGSINLIDEQGNKLIRRDMSPSCFLFPVLLYESSLPQQATFFRRNIYIKAGGIDPQFFFSMDKDLWIRFALTGGRFLRINYILANFRIHSKSKTITADKRRVKENYLIIERVTGKKMSKQSLRLRALLWKSIRYLTNPPDLFRGLIYRLKIRRN